MNYYNFHIGDYVTATVHLEPLEDLAYRRLLDMYYDTEQPIPLETHRVSRRLRLDTQIVDSVLKEFFTLTENGWTNGRCDADIAAYHRKAEANKANGKLGGRPKKTQSVNLANPTKTQNNLNQEPRTKNQVIGFDEFWAAYPLKKSKANALKAWQKLNPDAETLKAILDAIAWQSKDEAWTKDGGKFIPHGATWINAQRWLDEAPAEAAAPIPFDRAAYESKKKAEMAAAREAYKRDQAESMIPVRAAK